MKKRDIMDDARAFLGLPPHNTWTNYVQGDGIFANDCARHWGEQEFNDACAQARELHDIGMRAYNDELARLERG